MADQLAGLRVEEPQVFEATRMYSTEFEGVRVRLPRPSGPVKAPTGPMPGCRSSVRPPRPP